MHQKNNGRMVECLVDLTAVGQFEIFTRSASTLLLILSGILSTLTLLIQPAYD